MFSCKAKTLNINILSEIGLKLRQTRDPGCAREEFFFEVDLFRILFQNNDNSKHTLTNVSAKACTMHIFQ